MADLMAVVRCFVIGFVAYCLFVWWLFIMKMFAVFADEPTNESGDPMLPDVTERKRE